MSQKSQIDDDWTVKIPEEVREQTDLSRGDRVAVSVNDEGGLALTPSEGPSLFDDVSRRDVIDALTVVGSVAGFISVLDSYDVDDILDDRRRTPDPPGPADPIVQVLSGIGFLRQDGVDKFEQVGEIDAYVLANLFESSPHAGTATSRDDRQPEHVGSTTGPLGSDLVALSMGYDLNDSSRYDGALPYHFDLTPEERHGGRTLAELSEMSGDWAIMRTAGNGERLHPTPSGETMDRIDRPRYEDAYGMIVVKPVYAGWERYEKYDKYSHLTAFGRNRHLIVAGCHGEGTLAASRALLHDSFRSEVEDEISTERQSFQAVLRAEIDEYRSVSDPNGDQFEKPEFDGFELVHAGAVPTYDG